MKDTLYQSSFTRQYQNFHLSKRDAPKLSLCGDINPNPGPTAGKTTSKCSVCGRAVAKNQLAITCDSCCQQTHIKCGGITAKRYKQLLSCSNYCWDCPTCIGNLLQQLPFANVDDIIEQDPANDNPLQNMSSHGEPTIKFPRKTNKKECTIALLNVNSLPSKFIEIKEWLVDGVFDILCIQETKIDSTFPNSQFHVNGYSIFRRDRKKGGGGVMIFVRDSIIAMPIKIVCKFVEAILLDLTIGKTRFALIAAYKPPSVDNVPFTSDMYSLLDKDTSSLRASSPIWASEASLARTRELAAKPRGAEERRACNDLS